MNSLVGSLFNHLVTETKLRSFSTVALQTAYGLGSIALNSAGLFITSSNYLMISCFSLSLIVIFPSIFLMDETPKYLHKSGQVSQLIRCLSRIAKINSRNKAINTSTLNKQFFGENDLTNELLDKKNSINFSIILTNKDEKKSDIKIIKLATSFKLMSRLISLACIGGALYSIFYGLTTDIGSIGISSISIAGILLGSSQMVGYLAIIPFSHKMRRKTWTTIFLLGISCGILSLLGISIAVKLEYLSAPPRGITPWLNVSISTVVCSTLMSCTFGIFFLFINELFPTDLKGICTAVIVSGSKLFGAFAPYLGTISKNHGIHPLVGCGILLLVGIPLIGFLEETLVNDQPNKPTDNENNDSKRSEKSSFTTEKMNDSQLNDSLIFKE